MHATRLSVLACAALLGSSLLVCCGDDEGTSGLRQLPAGGEAGATTPQGGEAAGGTLSHGGSTSSAGERPAGDGGVTTQGGAPSLGGAPIGNEGGQPIVGPGGEELDFCPRLTSYSQHALNVEEAFVLAAYQDCRVTQLVPRNPELIELRNDLIIWNRHFWGCDGLPVDNFGLVWGTPALSQGDAGILIELYLAKAKADLALSPLEHSQMQAALERLAKPLIVDASTEPSHSACAMGGAGGEGGGTP